MHKDKEKFNQIKIVSDGTPLGTHVYDSKGVKIERVINVDLSICPDGSNCSIGFYADDVKITAEYSKLVSISEEKIYPEDN